MGRYTIYFSTLNDVKNYYEFLDKKKRGIEVNELEHLYVYYYFLFYQSYNPN